MRNAKRHNAHQLELNRISSSTTLAWDQSCTSLQVRGCRECSVPTAELTSASVLWIADDTRDPPVENRRA